MQDGQITIQNLKDKVANHKDQPNENHQEVNAEMDIIIKNLKSKMAEIDEMIKKVEEKKKYNTTPKETKRLIEEIRVPQLELLE
ncbi:MAG: hypothetical protein PHQ98_02505 [Candidatus ainarchaeum sp.]|nr:hypothetical protein [Candidatus ainarchaeum sp.]